MMLNPTEKTEKNTTFQNSHQTTITLFNNQPYSHSTNSQHEFVGGKNQKWTQIIENIGQKHIKHHYPKIDGKDMVKLTYELAKHKELAIPSKLNPETASFTDIEDFLRYELRYSESTIQSTLQYLKAMELHPKVPINLRHPDPEAIRMHFKYREIIEHASPNAITNNLKAIKRYLNICGINPDNIRYKPPIIPENNDVHIPKPEIVHNLITHTYSKDPYQNNLIQYLLCHNFMLGWRVPSEPAIMKTTNIDLDNECILIVEPKKHHRKRTIYPEPFIINGRRYKSFKNWLDYWRPKVENQYSKDYLYLQPDGRPFTDDTLRMKLSRAVKPVWSGYYPYVSRHWCAVARLLEWNLKVIRVRDFLGHVKIETTMSYLRTANQFYDRNEKDWLKRALRKHKTVFGDSSLSKKPATAFQEKPNFPANTMSSHGTSPVAMYGPGGIRTRDLQLRRLPPNPG